MKAESLAHIVSELSPQEQFAVKGFITFLTERQSRQPATTFQAAVDEFISDHLELLRRVTR